jgi:hypothetical protein
MAWHGGWASLESLRLGVELKELSPGIMIAVGFKPVTVLRQDSESDDVQGGHDMSAVRAIPGHHISA